MNKAVERTYECIKKRDTIGVFGDYDVDGASSTALLVKYFVSISQSVDTYVPDRKKDLAALVTKAMIGGALASWLTATIAGILI